MKKNSKRRVPRSEYSSPTHLSFAGFETPFYNQLYLNNQWVVLSTQIPWDDLVGLFNKRNPPKQTGRPALNPCVLIGAVIIKHILNLDDRETVSQITENIYLHYFLGYSSYVKEPPFDPSLFVDIRKRLGQQLLEEHKAITSKHKTCILCFIILIFSNWLERPGDEWELESTNLSRRS